MICRKVCVLASAFACLSGPSLAEPPSTAPFTEAVMPLGGKVLGVAIGPGGPDVEFGLDDRNGGLYRVGEEVVQITLSDGKGLANPTGMAVQGETIFIVDGNEVIAVAADGEVLWRAQDAREGVFFYDIEVLDEETLLISDFGNGRLVAHSLADGRFTDYAQGANVPSMARFEVTEDGIYAISWGSDDAWDGALYRLSESNGKWQGSQVATGFGNAESVALLDGRLLVGGYRGHETASDAKLIEIGPEGQIIGLEAGASSSGISDIHVTDDAVFLSYFRDGKWERVQRDEFE